ncbi:MAG TPA: hypothetical protein VMF52_20715 [Steroidobacteraceae bacterium]|nr:hypothetical protein [Steroidobacteraceae bacterium]
MFALLILGGILAVVGGIWLLVVTFQTSVLWGIGSLLIPLVSLIFVAMNWQTTKKPFLIQLAGIVLLIIATMSMPTTEMPVTT